MTSALDHMTTVERLFILVFADSDSIRFEAPGLPGGQAQAFPGAHDGESLFPVPRSEFGDYAPVVERWEQVTRPAPLPFELSGLGKPRLSAAFSEWMMGLPEGWVTGVTGLTRAQQIKAIGNGVVPAQAGAAIKELMERG